jgi:hypothetical protein
MPLIFISAVGTLDFEINGRLLINSMKSVGLERVESDTQIVQNQRSASFSGVLDQ